MRPGQKLTFSSFSPSRVSCSFLFSSRICELAANVARPVEVVRFWERQALVTIRDLASPFSPFARLLYELMQRLDYSRAPKFPRTGNSVDTREVASCLHKSINEQEIRGIHDISLISMISQHQL